MNRRRSASPETSLKKPMGRLGFRLGGQRQTGGA
jgi:hypothetical protein